MAEAMLSEEHRGSAPDLQEVNKETNGRTTRAKRKSGDSPSKTVVIQLPPKRRKVSSGFTIKDVGKIISLSLTSADREEAISTASTCFDHNDQAVHDQEILFGLDAVLTKHLGYLLCRRDFQQPGARQEFTGEIASTCKTLEMVYRGSVNTVAESFKRNGEEVMTILLKAIDDELCHRLSIVEASTEVHGSIEESDEKEPPTPDSNVTNDEQDKEEIRNDDEEGQTTGYCEIGVDRSPEGDMTLCKATKTLGHFARVETATQPMATHEGLLSVLITLMTAQPYYAIPAEARLNSVWIIANLACNTDNMVMMACHPELLVSLIIIAARTVVKTTPPAEVIEILRAQSIAVRALLNLSWAPENRIPMSENTDLVQVLSKLTIFRHSPKRGRTLQEIVLQTRRQAVGTLRNLAAAPRRNKIFLCNLKNGLLLNVLTDAVLNDADEGVKRRAFASINNLAVHDTAPMMVEHPALVLVLKDSLQDDVAADDDLKASAHGTLLVLERSITPDMDCYQNLRELLDAVNPTVNGSEAAATSEDVEQTSV
jgi:hypothetical protein